MSQPNLGKPAAAPTQKQSINIYTMMLIVSFIAILVACVLLWMELRRYGPEWPPWNTSSARPSVLNTIVTPMSASVERL